MAQVLQDITEMAVSFEKSRGYSLPSFEVNHTSFYSSHNPNSNQHCRSIKLPAKETQQTHPKPENFKCWQCQGDHLKKDCPTVTNQSMSKHSRPQGNKEKQHKLLRSFQKRFLNKKENVNEIAKAFDNDSSDDHWNQFFSEFKKLMCEERR